MKNKSLSEKRKVISDILLKAVPTKAGRIYRIIRRQDEEALKQIREVQEKVKNQPLKDFVEDIFSVIIAYDNKKMRRICFNKIVSMIYKKGYDDARNFDKLAEPKTNMTYSHTLKGRVS